ncbi:DUF6270 domain-containing protein [Priestia megaterium]|uniref:DUF6270 domain-containing protein n=1 Tax=Priestia megaterium TaxID=1404 RepID=UPI003008C28E
MMQDKQMIKVAVLGSCVTRDNFNRTFNPNYKEFYECVLLQNQSSLISLMASPVTFSPEEIDHLNEWDQWNVRTDLEKTFLTDLKQSQPDYLILDLFSDVFFGCIVLENSVITNNHWKLWQTSYYKNINEPSVIKLTDQQEEYLTLWKEAVQRLFSFVQTECPSCKVILHKARFASAYYNENKQVNTLTSSFDIETANELWNELDMYVEEHYDIDVIDLTNEQFLAFEKHPWGLFSLHYEWDYYRAFLQTLHRIVVRDYMSSQNNVFSYIYEQLEGERKN